MPDSSSPSIKMRVASSLMLIVGIVLAAIELFRALGAPEKFQLIMTALLVAAAFVGMSFLFQGIAMILEQSGNSESAPRSDGDVTHVLEELRASIGQLSDRVSHLSLASDEPRITPPAPMPAEFTAALRRINDSIEELREATLLDEPQRQARQQSRREQQRVVIISEATAAVEGGQLGRAGKLIAQLESQFSNDPAIADLRDKLTAKRQSTPPEQVERVKARVEDLMAISSWDEAHQLAAQFAENYPETPDSAALLMRVSRERGVFNESTAQQLFDEIKNDLERRRWRRALAGAQRLLNRFPEHRHAGKVRAQLKTIQANAEIEERQEQEQRIQELMHAKRFTDAISLAEDLIARFPNSPQAQTLGDLVPKMRELMRE